MPDGWRMTSGVATGRLVGMDPEPIGTADMDPIDGLNALSRPPEPRR
jgi:hypothetical protein